MADLEEAVTTGIAANAFIVARRLPMNSRGVSSRRLSLLIPDDAERYRETVEAGAWISDRRNIDEAVRMAQR